MLSRAVRGFGLQALPKRQAYQLARRTVTTDAASSHAEKEDVPSVSPFVSNEMLSPYSCATTGGRQALPSQALRGKLRNIRTRPALLHPQHHEEGAQADVLRYGSSQVGTLDLNH